MISSVFNTALTGMQRNQDSFRRHAEAISAWGTPDATDDPAGDVAGLLVARGGYLANLAVLKVADETLGTLIDTLA